MAAVRRRCVFYVSGFDPKGAAHYHALYREQAAAQAVNGGLGLEVGARKRQPSGNAAWTVRAQDGNATVDTWYECMRWDDVVRAHWPRHQWQLWRDILVTSWFYLRTGALWLMFRLSWPPALALFVPFALLVATLAGVPLLAGAAGWSAAGASGQAWAGVATGGTLAAVLLWGARRAEARWSMYWMMRSYAFTRLQALGRTPALEDRLDALAAQLAQRLREGGDDEVLVVGHSSGAIMACAIVARALRLQQPAAGTRLSLLTLGQWLPLLALVPQARGFRQELAELAMARALDWIDFSAPPDGCCFALSDPYAGCGIDVPQRAPDRPKLLSPRFAAMFEPAAYEALRRDKFAMHFQYLMAAPKPTEYDYFRITAGARTLGDRYAAVPSVVGYTDLRPLGH